MLIAITSDRRVKSPKSSSVKCRPQRPEIFLSEHLVEMVRACGGEAIVLPPGGSGKLIQWVLDNCDGIIISGGAFDIDPSYYGEEREARIDRTDFARTDLELELTKRAVEQDIPLLGVCGGMQVLAVACGGTLFQDISTQIRGALEHEQPTDPAKSWHDVEFSSSRWQGWFGADMIRVNSTHHQSVQNSGELDIVGRCPDGVIEAVEHPRKRFCVGVQWHPELLGREIFEAMVEAIGKIR